MIRRKNTCEIGMRSHFEKNPASFYILVPKYCEMKKYQWMNKQTHESKRYTQWALSAEPSHTRRCGMRSKCGSWPFGSLRTAGEVGFKVAGVSEGWRFVKFLGEKYPGHQDMDQNSARRCDHVRRPPRPMLGQYAAFLASEGVRDKGPLDPLGLWGGQPICGLFSVWFNEATQVVWATSAVFGWRWWDDGGFRGGTEAESTAPMTGTLPELALVAAAGDAFLFGGDWNPNWE